MDKFNNKLKYMFKSVSIFIIVTILLFISLFFGIRQVNFLNNQISESRKLELILNNKVTILKSVDNKLYADMNVIDIALPSSSAVLFAVNQIRLQATRNNISLGNMISLKPVLLDNQITKNPIEVEVTGELSDVYNFIESFSNSLPLMDVVSVKFDKSKTPLLVLLSINVYSTELPKTIPSVIGAVKELTDEEIKLMSDLLKYNLPEFTNLKPLENNQLKEDPFN